MNEKQFLLAVISDFREYSSGKKVKDEKEFFRNLDEMRDNLLKLYWEKPGDKKKIIDCMECFAAYLDFVNKVTELK